MKKTVSFYEFKEGFKKMDRDYYSDEGYRVLFEYLEELEEDTRESIEFDVIAIIIDFVEYEEVNDLLEDYDDYETIEDMRDDGATILKLENGGVILNALSL